MQHKEIVARYNDLAQSGTLGQDTWSVLEPGLRERNLTFGGRPLCTVLRPLFHTRRGWNYLRHRTETVLSAFNKMSRIMMIDPSIRAQVYLTPDEEYLVTLPTGYDTTIPTGRLDSFFLYKPDTVPGTDQEEPFSLHYIEFNGESPAGMAYEDVMMELFQQTPLMQTFAQEFNLTTLPARPHLARTILNIYHQWRGNRSKLPDVAIVDWAGVPTTTEFHLIRDYMATQGINVTICTPDSLEFVNGQMYAADVPVDFIYKRVLTTEMLKTYGRNHALIRALEARAVCMANPFNCKLLHKKASFAVVSDERNAHLLSSAEQAAIKAHIPWTRNVEERTTFDQHGEPIDLLPWASDNREHLVLKPNDEYGGKGVLIGWETEQSTWDDALAHALTDPSVIQERAEIAYEHFPSLDSNGQVQIGQRLVDCDPFLFDGNIAPSCLVRLSSVTLLNVTAGGGSMVPVFVVEPE